MRRSAGLLAGDEEAYLSVLGLPSADLGDRWHGDARLQAVADGLVLGRLPYLDEFVFRFNRRRTPHGAFRTLLGIGVALKPATYKMLISAEVKG
jgi:hypothetical protein